MPRHPIVLIEQCVDGRLRKWDEMLRAGQVWRRLMAGFEEGMSRAGMLGRQGKRCLLESQGIVSMTTIQPKLSVNVAGLMF